MHTGNYPEFVGKVVISGGIFVPFYSFLVEPCLTFSCVVSEPGKCWTVLDETKSLILYRISFLCIIIKSKLNSTSSFRAGEWGKAKHSPDFALRWDFAQQ